MKTVVLSSVALLYLIGCQAPPAPMPIPTPAASIEDGTAEHPYKVGHLHLVHLPTSNEIANRYPHDALRRDIRGVVSLVCSVEVDGHLTACSVKSEAPPGMKFGSATLFVSQLIVLQPGLYTGKSVDFTLRWQTASR